MYDFKFTVPVATIVAVAMAVGSIGCGGSDSDDDTGAKTANATSTTATPDAPATPKEARLKVRAAMARLQDAFYSGDAKTMCDGMTASITKQIAAAGAPKDKNATCESVVKVYAIPIPASESREQKATILGVTVKGDRASVRASQQGRRAYKVPFVKEDGEWKMNMGLGLAPQ